VKKTNVLLATLVVSGVLSSCGGVKDTKEYKELKSKIETLQSKIAAAKDERAKLAEDVNAQAAERKAALAEAKSKSADAKDQREKAFIAVGEALADNALRARVVQELWMPACVETISLLSEAAGKADSIDDRWALVDKEIGDSANYWYAAAQYDAGDPASFKKLDDETNALWDSCDQKGSRAFTKKCENVDSLVLKKDPERFKGRCLTGTVRIDQMDSNTGPCAFQGYVGGGYDVRTQFGMTLSTLTHSIYKDCEWIDKLKENMSITFWAFGLGAYSYKTTSGGNQTVPAFKLVVFRY